MWVNTPVYSVNNTVVPGLLRQAVVADSSDQIYTVTYSGERRVDLISSLFYGTPDLWWVIMEVNGLIDPLIGIRYGSKIRVPTKSRLSAEGLLNG